ncbi:hypothetical protein LQ246_10385, partial [Mycobacterium tuberculosis]|nr:hypothetical protein [Mycobacterium tuberculosis]
PLSLHCALPIYLLRRAGRPAEALPWYRIALQSNGSEPGREFLRRRIAECTSAAESATGDAFPENGRR